MLNETLWGCPACGLQDMTTETEVHTRFHSCRRFGGFTMPMVKVGTNCKIELHEREDYINGEDVQLLAGRPVMNAVITRDDGQDCVVYAPAATVRGG